MPEELNVQIRNEHGKMNNRRLRRAGKVPAVLYGHGQDSVSLAVAYDDLKAVLRHGSRLVNLIGGVSDSAFIRDLQWDTWGAQVLHVDFTRISMHEKVEIEVVVELRGEAPGVREGGVVQQLIHQVRIECPAGSIPEKLLININHLALEGEIKRGEIELPAGATLLEDPEDVAVQCMVPVEAPEELATEAGAVEPEVIGAKKEEEEAEES
jgi:large subunit ribosomal protein L25